MTGADGGSLEAGRAADLAVMDVNRVRHTPWNRPAASVAHSGRAGDVEMVIVAGEIIVENGRSTRVDEEEVRAEAAAAAVKLFKNERLAGFARDRPPEDD